MAMLSFHCDEIWSHPNKSLIEHLKKVGEIAKSSAEAIPLKFEENTIFPEIVHIIGLYHDIGKATPFFQEYLRENNPDQKARLKNKDETKHSLISAIATYFAIEEYLREKGYKGKYAQLLPIVSFLTVRRHHTNLQSATEDLRSDIGEVLKSQAENLYHKCLSFLPHWDIVLRKLKTLPDGWPLRKLSLSRWLKEKNEIQSYLVQHLLFSLLLDADKHEVTVGSHLERKPLPMDMIGSYRRKKGFDKPQKQIDIIRDEIYQKVINQVGALNLNRVRILSLSAPTGSGKTLTALEFAIRLRNRIINEQKYYPRIIYCLPFLSIIDQNAKVIEDVFRTTIDKTPTSDLFLIHHHLSDYAYKEEDTEYGADESEILIEGWDSEIVITTFVQFFHTLFSNRNRAIRKFHKVAGSIIILDEIQSFPHKYWLLFRETAKAMQKYLGTYFILSTATQPAIFDNTRELLTDKEKYFKSFERTQITVKIALPKTISELASELIKSLTKNPKSTMVVLNTIRSAENLFSAVKERLKNTEYEIYFLSSYVAPYERLKRIEKIRESTLKKVVISTQLVEAGVDIDLEKVVRDLGPVDSINQVAGRANRNQNIDLGEIEVVLLKDERNQRPFYSYIYDPILIDNTKRILEPYSIVAEENFLALATQYYQQILKAMSDDISRKYLEAIKMLDYERIGGFELIEEKGEKVDIFVELDDKATEIWNKYQEAMEITDPLKRKHRFLEIRGEFYQYVISVSATKARENLPPEVAGIRYIAKVQLDEFYNCVTGFKTESEVSIW
jgi:CRISPR-associated endonuclease/helicase Cas3